MDRTDESNRPIPVLSVTDWLLGPLKCHCTAFPIHAFRRVGENPASETFT